MFPQLLIQHHSVPASSQVNVQGQDKRRNALLLLLYSILIVAAIISRRPDAVFNAQFWAEDGTIWFTSVYNFGFLHALTLPQNGYFATFPRLAAAIAMLFPLASAPLVMNLLAIFVQALPPVFLLTRRFAYVGSQPVRLLMAFLMLAVPTSAEVHANVTNSMAFLALLAFLVLVAEPPTTKAERVFDVAVLCLSGATGPFSVVLLPVAALMYWIRRRPWTGALLGIECVAAAVQAVAILETAAGTRSSQTLGATPMLLFRIVGGQVIVSPLLGLNFLMVRPAVANAICVVAFAGAVLLLVYVFRRAPLELRLFMIFSVGLLAAALRTPLALSNPTAVADLNHSRCRRPILADSCYFVLLGVCVDAEPSVDRRLSARLARSQLLRPYGIGILLYWRYQPFLICTLQSMPPSSKVFPSDKTLAFPSILPDGNWFFTNTNV